MPEKLASGILPALCTPFDDSGQQVAVERVPALVDALLKAEAAGFFVCGGTGEGKSMTVAERKQMAEAAISAVSDAVPVILQVGATSTENGVELARHAASIGADAVASVAPIDQPHDLDAAVHHYTAIGAASDLPFYVYWLAQTADKNVTAEQYLEAMADVPNFTGIKFTDTNFFMFQQLVDLSDGKLNMITGPDEMCVAGMVMGSDAAIGSTYNVLPRLFVQMRRDFESGDIRDAMEAQKHANRVIRLMFRAGGVLPSIKAILGWCDIPVGPPREPFQPLTSEGEQILRHGLAHLEFEIG